MCKPEIKNQSARGAEYVSAEAIGAIRESTSCHMKDDGVQNARQKYEKTVSLVMGAICCQPASCMAHRRLDCSDTLSHYGQSVRHSFRANGLTEYCCRSTTQASGGKIFEW